MKKPQLKEKGLHKWQMQLHELIYESETTAGKVFDITLLIFILTSIIVVMLDSVAALKIQVRRSLYCHGMVLHNCVHHRICITTDLHPETTNDMY